MTDEERREAKELWQASGGESGTRLENYLAGYATCLDKVRPELDELRAENGKHRWRLVGAQVDPTIEVERARSAELLQLLKVAREEGFVPLALYLSGPKDYPMFFDSCDVEPCDFAMCWDRKLKEAIAEDEASRDQK